MEIPIRNKPYITEHRIYNAEDALLYITDCNLATVSHMARLKSKSKHEYQRQISIAQNSVNNIYALRIPVDMDSRVHKILSKYNRNVSEWAKNYEL